MNQAEKKRERQTGPELLRLLAGLGVVVLHFNYHPGGGGAAEAATGLNSVFLTLLECLCIGAVNVFILISGYYTCGRESVRIRKLVLLLLQTIVFQILAVAVSGVLDQSLSLKNIIGALIPINYYVILYVVLMLVSPFINRLLNHLAPGAAIRLVLVVFFIFSLATTAVDILKSATGAEMAGLSPVGIDGSMDGYSIVNFILVYLLGAYIRRIDFGKKCRTGTLILLLVGIVAGLFLWHRVLPDTAWTYCNPLVIAEACVLFLLFSRLDFRSKVINRLATATFTCYLVHETILARLDLGTYGDMSFPALTGILILTVSGIFLVSFGLSLLWDRISGGFFSKGPISRLTISASDDGDDPQ